MSAVTMNFIDEAWVVVVTENDETYTRIFKAREFAETITRGSEFALACRKPGLMTVQTRQRDEANAR
jgi:hypothetical protein